MLILAALLIVFPGFFAYLRGRAFLRREHNDDFAGRYFKYQQRSALCFWLCLILLYVLLPFDPSLAHVFNVLLDYTLGLGVILIYLAVYLVFVVGYALIDHVVRDDRLNLTGRVLFNTGLLFLVFWPYLLLSLALFGGYDYYVFRLFFIAILFALMYVFAPHFWRVILGAREIADPGLAGRVAQLAQKAGVKPVKIYGFSAAGLKFANAFAVGSWGGTKGIFISEYARQNLTPDEQAGIYAHEIGHLRANQTTRRSIALLLPLAAVIVMNILFPRSALGLSWAYFVFALILIKVLVPSQKFEREADLFAVGACGTPEAVISGLQRIYQLGILPRRFAMADEAKISHPSLSRRIKYMRQQTGQPMPRLEQDREFEATAELKKLIFATDSFVVEYQDGRRESCPYPDIQTMFIQQRKEGCWLMVKYRGRIKPLKAVVKAGYNDLAQVVEIVENGFNDQPAVDFNQYRRAYYMMGALIAFFGLTLSFFCGPALFVLGVVGLAKRSKWFYLSYCLGSGIMALAALIQPWPTGRIVVFVLALCVLISLADFSRFRHADEETGRATRIVFYAGLGLLAVQTLVLILIAGMRMPPGIINLYRFVFLNLAALSAGLLAAGDWRENRRLIALALAGLELIIFIFGIIRL